MYFYEVMLATAGTYCHLHTFAGQAGCNFKLFQKVHDNNEV